MTHQRATRCPRRMSAKIVRATAASAALLIVGGFAVSVVGRRAEVTPAIQGQEVARGLGCFACHGPGGVGGVADPTNPAGRVPDWSPGTADMFVSSEADIREWILHGAPHNDPAKHIGVESKHFIPMPAYEGLLSEADLQALVAFFRAVSGWAPDIPDQAHEGRQIARRLGCFQCHGPSGMGGVPNPRSFTGFIPPWDGEAYEELVRNEQELSEWILNGKIERLWKNPVARYFLQRQIIQMPAYRAHLSDDELGKIVAYIEWLRGDGP